MWPDAESEALARAACYDCHSNETEWPVYSYVAPMSWLVRRDVEAGRDELNLSELDQDGGHELDDAAETIEEGSMPPRQYLLLHPDARLSAEEEQRLMAAFEELSGVEDNSGRGNSEGCAQAASAVAAAAVSAASPACSSASVGPAVAEPEVAIVELEPVARTDVGAVLGEEHVVEPRPCRGRPRAGRARGRPRRRRAPPTRRSTAPPSSPARSRGAPAPRRGSAAARRDRAASTVPAIRSSSVAPQISTCSLAASSRSARPGSRQIAHPMRRPGRP